MLNRLTLKIPVTTSSDKKSPEIKAQVEQAVIKHVSRPNGALSFFMPLHYERNYAYPLVVWLHGRSGDERQLHRVLPLMSMRNYAAVGIAGTERCGRGWDWSQDDLAVQAAEQRVLDAVNEARERFHVHSDRIFLAGYESGGTMAMRLAMRRPQLFAGAASIGGPFPQARKILSNIQHVRKYPLWIAVRRDSAEYPVQTVCDELKLYHSAAMQVMLRQYPCGDELTTKMLSDLNDWLMERVTGMPSTPVEADAFPADAELN